MVKTAIALIGFSLGIAAAAVAGYFLWLEFDPKSSEIWTASTEIRLENGVVFPAGVELVVHRHMPEGFVTLQLFVNVEGDTLSKFETRVENHRSVVIPYWAEQ